MKAGELDPSRADVYGVIGDTFQHLQNFPEALNAYERAVALDVSNVNYQVGAGLSAVFSGDNETATYYLEKAASVNDTIPQIFYGLSLVSSASGDTKAAQDLISKAIKLDPENPEYRRLFDECASASA
ncbi:MAG: tetratricopeptide repeat protein [Acidimicrobiales bacterium]